MQTRTRYGLLLMLLAALLMFAAKVRCQDIPDHPPHPSVEDFYDSLRILPVQVLYYNEASGVIDWKFEDGQHIEVGQFQVTTTTYIRDKIVKGAKMMTVYCAAKHGTGTNERIKYLLQVEGMK